MVLRHQEKRYENRKAKLRQRGIYDGLDIENQIAIPVEAKLFFLTSLFIELIDGLKTSNALVTTFDKQR